MIALLYPWLRSLSIFFPSTIISFFADTIKTLIKAFIGFGLFLLPLVVVDIGMHIALQKSLIQLYLLAPEKLQTVGTVGALVYLLIEVIWFLVITGTILFIRKRSDGPSLLAYLWHNLIRYIHISLLISLILMLLVLFVISLGITHLPTPHWILVLSLRIFELSSIFFWLDSRISFQNIFISLEKGINFLFYNLPALIVIIAIIFGVNFLINQLFLSYGLTFDTRIILGNNNGHINQQIDSIYVFLCTKYIRFLIEMICISMIYVVYDRTKNVSYSKSFIEK